MSYFMSYREPHAVVERGVLILIGINCNNIKVTMQHCLCSTSSKITGRTNFFLKANFPNILRIYREKISTIFLTNIICDFPNFSSFVVKAHP